MSQRILSLAASIRFPLFAAAYGFALFITGCESDGGIAARTQEKSAAYAKLKISEKRFIDRGIIAIGFTPDMVYMAMGRPTKVESKDYPEGTRELWTYNRYYPNYEAGQGFKTAPYSTEAPYQRSLTQPTVDPSTGHINYLSPRSPIGDTAGQSLAVTGPPQGASSGEPADIQSYTFMILFKDGKVARFGANPNYN